jgi:hypothetical protein
VYAARVPSGDSANAPSVRSTSICAIRRWLCGAAADSEMVISASWASSKRPSGSQWASLAVSNDRYESLAPAMVTTSAP